MSGGEGGREGGERAKLEVEGKWREGNFVTAERFYCYLSAPQRTHPPTQCYIRGLDCWSTSCHLTCSQPPPQLWQWPLHCDSCFQETVQSYGVFMIQIQAESDVMGLLVAGQQRGVGGL